MKAVLMFSLISVITVFVSAQDFTNDPSLGESNNSFEKRTTSINRYNLEAAFLNKNLGQIEAQLADVVSINISNLPSSTAFFR